MYPLDRLDTPPSDEDHQQLKRQRRHSSIATDELPPTPRSITTMDESSDEETEIKKDWTLDDDEELLTHVLGLPTINIKWKQVETQFGDRHMAKMCAERWDYLKKQLLKDVRTVKKEENDSSIL